MCKIFYHIYCLYFLMSNLISCFRYFFVVHCIQYQTSRHECHVKILNLVCCILQGTRAVSILTSVYRGRAKMGASASTTCMATSATAPRITWVTTANFSMMCAVLFLARTMGLV